MKKQTGNLGIKGGSIKRFSLESFLEEKYNRHQRITAREQISWLDRKSALRFHEEWINDSGGHIKLESMSLTELQRIRKFCCINRQLHCVRIIDTHLKQRAQARDIIAADVRDQPIFKY